MASLDRGEFTDDHDRHDPGCRRTEQLLAFNWDITMPRTPRAPHQGQSGDGGGHVQGLKLKVGGFGRRGFRSIASHVVGSSRNKPEHKHFDA